MKLSEQQVEANHRFLFRGLIVFALMLAIGFVTGSIVTRATINEITCAIHY